MNDLDLLDKKLAERERLNKEIDTLMRKQRSERLAAIRQDVARYEITAEEIFGTGSRRAGQKKTVKAAVKYRDPETGKTWSGRGREPSWLQGRKREDFLVD